MARAVLSLTLFVHPSSQSVVTPEEVRWVLNTLVIRSRAINSCALNLRKDAIEQCDALLEEILQRQTRGTMQQRGVPFIGHV